MNPIPKDLADAIQQAAAYKCTGSHKANIELDCVRCRGFMEGATFLWQALVERAGKEFDEKVFEAEAKKWPAEFKYIKEPLRGQLQHRHTLSFEEGARRQHEQDFAALEAMRLERDTALEALEYAVAVLPPSYEHERERIYDELGSPGLQGCGPVTIETKYDAILAELAEMRKGLGK